MFSKVATINRHFPNSDLAKIYAYSQGGFGAKRSVVNDSSDENDDHTIGKKQTSNTASTLDTNSALFNHYLSLALKQQQQNQHPEVYSISK